MVGRETALGEYPTIDAGEVEVRFAGRGVGGHSDIWTEALVDESAAEVVIDFVAVAAYTGPDGGMHLCGVASQGAQAGDGVAHDTPERTSPSGVNGGHISAVRSAYHDRHAIGCTNADRKSGGTSYEGIDLFGKLIGGVHLGHT